jgi:hypothetical protein
LQEFNDRDVTGMRIGLIIAAPYIKLSMAGYSERVRMTSEVMRDRDDPCSPDFLAVLQAAETALPRWNWLARTSMAHLPRAWGSLTQIRLDGELTRLVIEARVDSGDLHAHPSPVASTVCKGVSWIWTSFPDGRTTIAAKPPGPCAIRAGATWSFSFRTTS